VALVQDSFADIGVEGDEFDTIVVRDLAPGGRAFKKHVETNDYDLYSDVFTLLLRADGAAAWMLKTQGKYREIDVLGAHDRSPTPIVYAKGIAARGFGIGAAGVTWTQDGTQRTVAIP
jgi:hypothetical protein